MAFDQVVAQFGRYEHLAVAHGLEPIFIDLGVLGCVQSELQASCRPLFRPHGDGHEEQAGNFVWVV